jgi:hypothetical protein
MVLGIILGPVYYGYCLHFSGRTGDTFTLSDRAERWVSPDGTILRFKGGLGYKPLTLALAPEMNRVALRLRFELPGSTQAQPAQELQYQATLLEGEHTVLERPIRFALAPGGAHAVDIGPLEIPYAAGYLFVLEEAGRLAATPGVSLSIVEKIEAPNMPVVWTGLVLLIVAFVIQLHALWSAHARRPLFRP